MNPAPTVEQKRLQRRLGLVEETGEDENGVGF
jgi:hypothetical protein